MAIISKNDQNPDPGAGPPDPPTNGSPAPAAPGDAAAAPETPQERRHNLPLKTAPVVGRKAEMQRVVAIFDRIRRDTVRPRRVEVVGPLGVGASTVAIELARRAGRNFPGGAWYVHLGMGEDVAWATVAALRGNGRVKDLATAARTAREKLADEPKALLVLDGVTSADQAMSALPPASPVGADVFIVAERPLGTVDDDQVCEVSPPPRHAARRMAHSMLRHSQPDAKAPAVRTLDGLAITATLGARAALAYAGREGPLSIDDTKNAIVRLVRLVGRHPTALELLLLMAVAHPVSLPVDALFAALVAVRKGRGKEPTPDETGQGVMWLAHAAIIEPMDEQHFSMHPAIQAAVQGMTASPADLEVARAALAAGLISEAEASIGEDGVDLPRSGLHQIRFLATQTTGETKAKLEATLAKLHAALGVGSASAN
jgi:hypothetical protein